MLWVFGYGSLVWRPDFPYVKSRRGYVQHYKRGFWQGSPDHRGTPTNPGRVVTLLECHGANCWGVAYGVRSQDERLVYDILDARESGGYERAEVEVHFRDHGVIPALTYIASPSNPNFLGEASWDELLLQVRHAKGESGNNWEYVCRLAQALDDLGIDDAHVQDLAKALVAGEEMKK
ncbi:MAG: gamma-glutamylcyclotransferase [Myxococcota bacterium]|nr:gamma-glutamylcyclotransferase [Myxococcota bacterium]